MPHADFILDQGGQEIRRLQMQSDALAPEAEVMLDCIHIDRGWRCLELGCGTDELAMYLPETIRSVREALLSRGIYSERGLADDLAVCEAQVRDPDTTATHIGAFQVWGREPTGKAS